MEFEKAEKFIWHLLKQQLPSYLYYHSIDHTKDVLEASRRIAGEERVNGTDLKLLETAVLFHDVGFIIQIYDHEKIGCDIAVQNLPQFGYDQAQVETICGMIMATKIPQSPQTLLEQIICDADLEYLGRDDFDSISNNLYKELSSYEQISKEDWFKLQANFLEQHHYFTQSVIKLRSKKKEQHLESVRRTINELSQSENNL